MKVNQLVRIEYGLAFLFTFYIYLQSDFSIWLFFILLLAPDITMLGYLINNHIGSTIYNIGHTVIVPMIFLLCFFLFSHDLLLMIAFIWFAHIFMDRSVGYGLKYRDSFKDTHIQKI